jgi:predicted transcriptional regulator YheO
MIETNTRFTVQDFEIIESYKPVVQALAAYLGEGCEIVLHSLHDLERSVVQIENGHHSGRSVGSPITDLALNMLAQLEGNSSQQDYIIYNNKSKNGEPIKAATIVIRGSNLQAIGLVCLNYYLNTPLHAFLESFSNIRSEQAGDAESYVKNVDELIERAVIKGKTEIDNNPTIPNAKKTREIILELNRKGVFQLKDAVIKVSKILGISKNTIYMYLRSNSKNQDSNENENQ